MPDPRPSGGRPRPPDPALHRAHARLAEARRLDRDGKLGAAIAAYEAAVAEAERQGATAVAAEALRRLAVVRFHRGEPDAARALCRRSYEVAAASGDAVLAGEALNTLGGLEFEGGEIDRARACYDQALALGGSDPHLRGRIEQNLGILANIRGDFDQALAHYQASLRAFQTAGDARGCAIAYHNLGMISADRKLWSEAERYFAQSQSLAREIGEVHLQGLCLLNGSEVHVAHQRFDAARRDVEEALGVFDRLGAELDKADAYKVLGIVFRETGRPALAEARFRAAIELAARHGSVLSEAEASRELALLFRDSGRNQDALRLLNAAYRLFGRLDARTELVDVAARVADLESTYLAVVRDWGQSIESADSYTHGHCERVAGYALRLVRALGLEDHELTTLRLGAYLHDVGKLRVPHEILNKAGPLTREEFEVIQMHPVWGVELLEDIDFPWDIKPIIRWHHEKHDGSGYPDRLRGDEIPLAAQIIGAVDVYDALTTTRSYRAALAPEEALVRMTETRHWWRPEVFEAFTAAFAVEPAVA